MKMGSALGWALYGRNSAGKYSSGAFLVAQMVLKKIFFKSSACNIGDLGSIPGLGRSPGGGNGNPLQYSCLRNPRDRGAWWATVHGVTKSQTGLSH